MPKNLSVAFLPSLITEKYRGDDGRSVIRLPCAVVIDVLRATSVMATAGRNGAAKISTCGEIGIARHLAQQAAQQQASIPLLCGERSCVPIDGFDLGNSPAEYSAEVVADREVLMTTTNGTRAIASVKHAKRLLTVSFLNLGDTIESLQSEDDVLIVCAGTEKQISREDVLLAGAMIDRFGGTDDERIVLDDSARLAWAAWRQVNDSGIPLGETLRDSLGGRNLLAAGYGADLDRCAAVDSVGGTIERLPAQPDDVIVSFGWTR
ncbi:2-phosphosulfolactate phosphatase [Roseiconus lacunae]|uniref:2-phosphosulfolactate phosphatase n=1 Tax=Roseiconus lacunae TaxID=2605694 RepID=UPI0030939CD0|nr:2-phosphosulfolactate phosphatase [Stieleria sp. HD01]